jgi:hypothetical protein
MCCNPARGRVEFEEGRLIKSSFITKDKIKACQLIRTKIKEQKITLDYALTLDMWLNGKSKGLRAR